MSTTARKLIKELGDKQMASEKLSSTENNDCVVRAVQHTFGVDYIDAHHFCEMKLMREPQDGVYTSRYLPKVKQAFGLKIKQLGKKSSYGDYRELTRPQKSKVECWSNAKQKWVVKRKVKQVRYKVKEFVKAHSEGSFIVIVSGHAMALVDGKIIGNWDDDKRPTREIVSAYKVG